MLDRSLRLHGVLRVNRRLNDRRLVDGLDYHERIARLETAIFGVDRGPKGLQRDVDAAVERLQVLESEDRRRRMPRVVRWILDWRKR